MAVSVDPKVYFANERTFLKWMHTSVTLGSVATGLLGASALSSASTVGGFNSVRAIGLVLLALAIVFCLHALTVYHRRARLLNARRSDGFDENWAPLAMAGCLSVALGVVYVGALFHRTTTPAAPHPQ